METELSEMANLDKITKRIEKKIKLHLKRSDKARFDSSAKPLLLYVAEREQGRAEGLNIAKHIVEEARSKK
jgi:hypothetical protein